MPSEPAVRDPFSFDGVERDGAAVTLRYSVEGHRFAEVVHFPRPLPSTPAIDVALRVLHLVAGVSYYKAFLPRPLRVPELTAAERALLTALYDEGLREMAYVNDIALPLPVELVEDPALGTLLPPPDAAALHGALVPVGGGKDSALVGSLLTDGVLLSVNPKDAHRRQAAHLGRPLLEVERVLDAQLRDLAAQGAPNGHVPVTAIVAAISVVAALALGRRDVALGLERSASEPTLVHRGVAVNHQFSKSAEAEALLSAAVAPTGVRCFSLLRPLTELAIAGAVVARGLAEHVLSCNEAFTMWRESTASREQRACGTCPKCLFTALIVAPFSTPAAVRSMYGRDVLDAAESRDGLRALWSDAKPFECVGERLESAAAMVLLHDDPTWSTQALVRALGDEAGAVLRTAGVEPAAFLEVGSLDTIPAEHRAVLEDLARELEQLRGSLLDAAR